MSTGRTGSVGPGTVLAGRYRLEDLLVDSAGGRFWRATDTVLARNVAVHAVSSADDRAEGLLEAARLSATVNDSHLLRVLDCDDDGELCWVVNEWGEGLSLDLLLDRGPLAPARAAWLAHEVAQAVAAGHAQGVAHGRLSPETVLVTHTGAVKLIGYVVDAVLHAETPEHPALGPLDGEEVDVLGIAGVLYAGLTGRWPGPVPSRVPEAPSENGYALRPRQVRAGVPRLLDTICERVLHREGSRHGTPLTTAHEVAAALAEATGAVPTAVPPAGTARTDDGDHPDDRTITHEAAAEPPEEGTTLLGPVGASPGAGPDGPEDPEDPDGTDSTSETAVTGGAIDPASSEEATTVLRPAVPTSTEAGGAGADEDTQAAAGSTPLDRRPEGAEDDTGAAADPVTDTGSLEATQAVPPVGVATAPPFEHARLHHEPLEGPDDLHPMRAPEVEPPPPPFEDSPERPLFATTERRRPPGTGRPVAGPPAPARTAVPAAAGATAHPAPPGPEYWPFEGEDHAVTPPPDHRHAGRGWLRTAVVVALVLLTGVAMVVAFSLGRISGVPGLGDDGGAAEGEDQEEEAPTSQVLDVAAVADFDPEGDRAENPETTGNAVDGDPSTTWTTLTYFNRPDLGGLKSGVGLMLDLGSDQDLREVEIAFGAVPTDLEVHVAPPGVTSAPSDLSQMELVAEQQEVGQRAQLELEPPSQTRFVVIWLTLLPPTEGGFRGEVADIELRS